MARNKTNRTPPSGEDRKSKVPLIVRYLPIAITAMTECITGGDEVGAEKVRTEIAEQLAFAFRGVALQAMLALVEREWQLAKNFASPHVIDVAFDEADVFSASRFHDDPPTIDG